MINVRLWPKASASLKPKIRLAAAFHPTMFPLGSATTTASPSTLNNCARSSCVFMSQDTPSCGEERGAHPGASCCRICLGCLNGFCRVQPGNVFLTVTEIAQNFIGVLAQHGRGLHFDLQVRELDRAADRQVLAANLVVDFHDRAALAQVGGFRQFLHGETRPAWNAVLPPNIHRFLLALVLNPLFN